MTNIETMKMALDALEACEEDYIYDGEDEYECDKIDWEKRNKAIAALRQAISEAEQTPNWKDAIKFIEKKESEYRKREMKGSWELCAGLLAAEMREKNA